MAFLHWLASVQFTLVELCLDWRGYHGRVNTVKLDHIVINHFFSLDTVLLPGCRVCREIFE